MQMSAVLGPSFNCSRRELQYLQLKLELYYALQSVYEAVLYYANAIGLTDGVAPKDWIRTNLVCGGGTSPQTMNIVANLYGTFDNCSK